MTWIVRWCNGRGEGEVSLPLYADEAGARRLFQEYTARQRHLQAPGSYAKLIAGDRVIEEWGFCRGLEDLARDLAGRHEVTP